MVPVGGRETTHLAGAGGDRLPVGPIETFPEVPAGARRKKRVGVYVW